MQEKKNRGSLFIVSAPSGAGKTTLCKRLVSTLPNLKFSVSYTTRRRRSGEVNGRDYIFVSRDEFRRMIGDRDFLEWAEIHGELYGTSKKKIEELTASGNDVVLDIDVQGASQIRKQSFEAVYVFILPPSLEALRTRLEERMTETGEMREKRLKAALSEIGKYTDYDYVIINLVLEAASRELEAIVLAERVRVKKIDPSWIEGTFVKEVI
ncbi:MAG: guanylate kinase [Nitrospirota bacterium]